MARRAYGQFCGLVHALEAVGERWALLIIRDLLVGPKRFTDLHRGLPRIPTNVLSARLREMEQFGVVRRRVLPRPAGSIVYELTEYGADLEGVVLALGRWGARSMREPAPGDIVTVDSLIMAMRSTFRRERARGLRLGYELRFGDVVVHARLDRGRLHAAAGPLPGADLVIEAGPALRDLMAAEITPDEAIARGLVRLTGDLALLKTFAEVFHIPPAPVPAVA